MIIKKPCPYCNKQSDIKEEFDMGPYRMTIFMCGHSVTSDKLEASKREEAFTEPVAEAQVISKSLYEQLVEETPTYCEIHQRECIRTLTSSKGHHLFPYQQTGIITAYKNEAKFIFADEMGLGKTIEGLGTIALNKDRLLPAIFLCKKIAKTNWQYETIDWLPGVMPQVIWSGSDTPYEFAQIHIITYDMLNQLNKIFKFSEMKAQVVCPKCNYKCDEGKHVVCPSCSKGKTATGDTKQTAIREGNKTIIDYSTRVVKEEGQVVNLIPYVDPTIGGGTTLKDQNRKAWYTILSRCKTVILDEVHLLKNPSSQRSRTLKTICSMVPHILCMSGTLIKNNASEYFVPLNLVKPQKYWRYESFQHANLRQDLVTTVTGKMAWKYTGFKNPEYFFDSVKDCLIRRTVEEVLPELPRLWKQPKYFDMESQFQELYDQAEKDFAKWFDNSSEMEIRGNILGQLAKLRHQTSNSKIDFTISLALDFLLETDKKLAIFTHHINAREILASKMMEFFAKYAEETHEKQYLNIVRVLTTGDKEVQEQIEDFKNDPEQRILILSTLAHGESINLQFMSNSILHERQWNPANEDQSVSGRFRRIGQKDTKLTCQIPIAIGTIDEYMFALNERKRVIADEIDTRQIGDYNTNSMMELAAKIAEKGREKWRL